MYVCVMGIVMLSGPGDLLTLIFFSFCRTISSVIWIFESSWLKFRLSKRGTSSCSGSTVNTLEYFKNSSAFSWSDSGVSSSSEMITSSNPPSSFKIWLGIIPEALGVWIGFLSNPSLQ